MKHILNKIKENDSLNFVQEIKHIRDNIYLILTKNRVVKGHRLFEDINRVCSFSGYKDESPKDWKQYLPPQLDINQYCLIIRFL